MRGFFNGFRLILGLGFGLAVAMFWVDNATPVPLKFGFWELAEPVPLWLVAFVAAGIGLIVPRVLLARGVLTEYLERRRLRKRVEALEREVMQLRRLPFDGLTAQSMGQTRNEDLELAPVGTITAGIRPTPVQRPRAPAVRAQVQAGPEILPAPAPAQPAATGAVEGDPYASLFDAPDPALHGIEDAEVTEASG